MPKTAFCLLLAVIVAIPVAAQGTPNPRYATKEDPCAWTATSRFPLVLEGARLDSIADKSFESAWVGFMGAQNAIAKKQNELMVGDDFADRMTAERNHDRMIRESKEALSLADRQRAACSSIAEVRAQLTKQGDKSAELKLLAEETRLLKLVPLADSAKFKNLFLQETNRLNAEAKDASLFVKRMTVLLPLAEAQLTRLKQTAGPPKK